MAHHAPTGVMVVADAWLPPDPHCRVHGAAERVAQLYLAHGSDAFERLEGEFAIALWDPRTRCLLLLRDGFGCRPLYYRLWPDGRLAFSSLIAPLIGFEEAAPGVNPDWIADYLTRSESDPEITPYLGVSRLPPGHLLTWHAGRLFTRRVFYFDPPDPLDWSAARIQDAFAAHLERAVRDRLTPGIQSFGAELSGGLDSSAVVSIAAAGLPVGTLSSPLRTYCHGLSPQERGTVWPFEDETAHAALVANHLGLTETHHIVPSQGHSFLDHADRIQAVHGGPLVDGFACHSDPVLRQAQADGVGVMLSGQGGDQYASAPCGMVIGEYAQSRAWRALWRECRAAGQARAPGAHEASWRTFLRASLRAEFGALYGWLRPRADHVPFGQEVLASLTVPQSFYQEMDLAGRVDRASQQGRFRSVAAQQASWVGQAPFSLRLESSWVAGFVHGVTYRYPLLDLALVRFVLSIPVQHRVFRGQGRLLMHRFLQKRLPASIAWRRDKAQTALPGVAARMRRAMPVLRQRLEEIQSGPLAASYIDFAALFAQMARLGEGETALDQPVDRAALINLQRVVMLGLFLQQQEKRGP
ncbi:MAG: asparagine synthetase B family protein [Rhodospirillaceae bacterium]